MNRKKTLKDKLTLTPTSDWVDPAAPHGGKKSRVYTSGTLYEKETGRYADPGLQGEFARMNRNTAKKKNIGDGTATVTKGAKVPAARRGVGQETVDGFINKHPKSVVKTAMKNRKKPPRRR